MSQKKNAEFTDLAAAISHAEAVNKTAKKPYKVYRVEHATDPRVYFVVHQQGQVEAMGFVARHYGLDANPWSEEQEEALQESRLADKERLKASMETSSPEELAEFKRLAESLLQKKAKRRP